VTLWTFGLNKADEARTFTLDNTEVEIMASKSSRLPIRREVQSFAVAAERLLREPELTPEECHIICEYLATMSRDNHPWSGHLKSTVSGQQQCSTKTAQRSQHEDNR
jgi:hypothetical protein